MIAEPADAPLFSFPNTHSADRSPLRPFVISSPIGYLKLKQCGGQGITSWTFLPANSCSPHSLISFDLACVTNKCHRYDLVVLICSSLPYPEEEARPRDFLGLDSSTCYRRTPAGDNYRVAANSNPNSRPTSYFSSLSQPVKCRLLVIVRKEP